MEVLLTAFARALCGERYTPGKRLVDQDAQRIDVGGRTDRISVVPLFRRHVRIRTDPDVGWRQVPVTRGRVSVGYRPVGEALRLAAGRERLERQTRGLLAGLGDAEVEQLGNQAPAVLDHHHVRGLQVAVDDSALVCRRHDLRDTVEERHELFGRHRAAFAEPGVQRGAGHHLHGDPEHAVRLAAECIDMGRVRMIELRGELCFAQEAFPRTALALLRIAQHLDHRVTLERRLEAAIHGAAATPTDPLAENEFSERSPTEVAICHRLESSVRQPRHRAILDDTTSPVASCGTPGPRTPGHVVGILAPVSQIARSRSVGARDDPTLWLQNR